MKIKRLLLSTALASTFLGFTSCGMEELDTETAYSEEINTRTNGFTFPDRRTTTSSAYETTKEAIESTSSIKSTSQAHQAIHQQLQKQHPVQQI